MVCAARVGERTKKEVATGAPQPDRGIRVRNALIKTTFGMRASAYCRSGRQSCLAEEWAPRMKKRGVSQSVPASETLMNRGVPRSGSRPSTRWRPGLRPESLGSQSETQRDRTCLTDRDTPRLVSTYHASSEVDPIISTRRAQFVQLWTARGVLASPKSPQIRRLRVQTSSSQPRRPQCVSGLAPIIHESAGA